MNVDRMFNLVLAQIENIERHTDGLAHRGDWHAVDDYIDVLQDLKTEIESRLVRATIKKRAKPST